MQGIEKNDIDIDKLKLNKSISIKAKELALLLGDKEHFFVQFALTRMPAAQVESFILVAKHKAKNPPAYFNTMVKKHLGAS